MNEKIKQLALQAGIQDNPDQEGLTLFAELIVEECRDVLTNVYGKVPLECCGHFLYADEMLAKHFYGVEE